MSPEYLEYYEVWHEKKKFLADKNHNLLFKEKEIWWCSLGMNLGKEVYGKGTDFRRPVLIIKKLSESLCIVVPLTSKPKHGTWFSSISFHNKVHWVMLYQIRVVDSSKRFHAKLGTLYNSEFVVIKEKLKQLLELF